MRKAAPPWPGSGPAGGRPEGAPELGSHRALAQALLEAQVLYAERRRERREALAALALSSVLPWVSLAWPGLLSSAVRTLALVLWCALLVVTAAVGGSELRWYRRMVQRADEIRAGGERPPLHAPGGRA
jgi:hypothetical protein